MNRHRMILIAFVVLALATSLAAFADTATTDAPVVDTISEATTRYLPIPFTTHDYHAEELEIGCQECHHTTALGDAQPPKCGDCHDKKGAKVSMEQAAHGKCLDCHLAFVAENPDSTAPTQCLGCHQERK